jgi:hypothetical protein
LEWEVEKCGEAPATQTIPQYTHYADSTYWPTCTCTCTCSLGAIGQSI